MDNKDISFNEVEANYIAAAIRDELRNRRYDPLLDEDWEELKALRGIMDRIYAYLEGEGGE